MDSHPSGFLKGIQLLTIETDDFCLAITGNLDLQKYNSDSYKSFINNNESMYFNCLGNVKEVKIYDVQSRKLVERNGQAFLPIFFENGMYEVQILPKENKEVFFWHEYEGFRNALKPFFNTNALTGMLHFQNEVGYSNFEIRTKQGETLLSVVIEVYPTKLDYKKDYRALLDEVNEEIYNLAYSFLKRTYLQGSAEIYKEPTGVEFYRLLQKHFDDYMKAVHLVEEKPHRQMQTIHEEVRGDRLRKQDSIGRAYLRKNARLFVEVEKGIPLNGTQMLPKKGLLIKKVHTYDTHENRYIKMTLERLYKRIETLTQLVVDTDKKFDKPTDPYILKVLQEMKHRVSQKLRSPFWRNVGQLDRSIMSIVLQMATGYRDVYQIYSTLSKGIVLRGELYKMSIKDIATLYEYWTFLRLGKILTEKCEQISQDVVKVDSNGLLVNLRKDSGAKRVYKNKQTGEIIALQYQFSTNKSITVNQKPDTMLSIEKLGRNYHYQYIFDAKYRINFGQENNKVGPGPMEEDINTMHRYRDAIVSESGGEYERTAFGAYVLFPWNDMDQYQNHHLYKSIEKVNIGGLPFLPNATDLVENIIDNLLNKSADELQREGILPKGTKEFLYPNKTNQVLIIPIRESVEKIIIDRMIQVSVDSLPKQWNSAKKLALYTSDGVREYGNIVKIERKENQLHFYVESWASKLYNISTNTYQMLEPILIEEHIFDEANNIPELLISSNEQRQLWMMLKGISSDAEIQLNSKKVTQESRIESFELYGHEFIWKPNKLLYIYDGIIEEFSMNEIKHNTYKVLKELAAKL